MSNGRKIDRAVELTSTSYKRIGGKIMLSDNELKAEKLLAYNDGVNEERQRIALRIRKLIEVCRDWKSTQTAFDFLRYNGAFLSVISEVLHKDMREFFFNNGA